MNSWFTQLTDLITLKGNKPVPGANITFTGDKIFDTDVPTIDLGQSLTSENVMSSLRNCVECNFEKDDISLIQKSFNVDKDLSNQEFMTQLSGIFIHDKVRGRALVKGTGISKRIVSIEV